MAVSRSASKDLAVQVRRDILTQTPFYIEDDPALGLHLCAKRLIKSGEVLYSDPALISVPCATLDDVSWDTPLCLGCAVLMSTDSRCSQCDWPLCGDNCPGRANHLDNECGMFCKYGSTFPPDDEHVSIAILYAVVQLIRGLKVSSNVSKVLSTLQWNDSDIDVQGIIKLLGFPDEFGNELEWRRNHGIFTVNTHSSTFSHNEDLHCVQCLFPLYSFVNHSCSPNCEWGIFYEDGLFSLNLRPIVDISSGQMITISYMPEWNTLGNYRRGRKIMDNLNFTCGCARCLDSTEFGSYFDAFMCFRCGNGYMVVNQVEWKCESCKYEVPIEFGVNLTKLIWTKLRSIREEIQNNECNESKVVSDLERFMKMHSGTYLHPNHSILMEAESALIRLYQEKKECQELDPGETKKLKELGQHLIQVFSKIGPGASKLKGT